MAFQSQILAKIRNFVCTVFVSCDESAIHFAIYSPLLQRSSSPMCGPSFCYHHADVREV